MPKRTKVIPIIKDQVPTPGKARRVAYDEKTQRIIIGLGSQRMALDFVTRFTNLPPHAGDRPATVLLMKTKPAGGRKTPKESI